MLKEEYRAKLEIGANQRVVETGDSRSMRKGQDTDIATYDVLGEDGVTVLYRLEIRDSIGIYPPFERNVWFVATALDGSTIRQGALTGIRSI